MIEFVPGPHDWGLLDIEKATSLRQIIVGEDTSWCAIQAQLGEHDRVVADILGLFESASLWQLSHAPGSLMVDLVSAIADAMEAHDD